MDCLKENVFAYFLISLISLSAIPPVEAQSANAIIIKGDGSVLGTDKIHHVGNLYSLTDSVTNVPIVVECNNIILDGGGFTLQGASWWGTPAAINLTCTNTTVQNFIIKSWEVGILGAYNNNTITNNAIESCERALAIYADYYVVTANSISNTAFGVRILNANSNLFVGNTLRHNGYGFSATNSWDNSVVANNIENNNVAFSLDATTFQVYHNNFIDQNRDFEGGWYTHLLTLGNSSLLPSWDDGYPSGGNYYNDYKSRYPNASEIDTSGIGNIPYVINFNPNVTDNYPLIEPTKVSATTLPSPSSTSSPTNPSPTVSISLTPTGSSSSTPSPSVPEFSSWIILPLALITVLLAVLVGNRSKRKILTHC